MGEEKFIKQTKSETKLSVTQIKTPWKGLPRDVMRQEKGTSDGGQGWGNPILKINKESKENEHDQSSQELWDAIKRLRDRR